MQNPKDIKYVKHRGERTLPCGTPLTALLYMYIMAMKAI